MRTLSPRLVLILAILGGLLLFLLDLATLDVQFWMPSLLLLIVVYRWGTRRGIYITAALLSLLILINYQLDSKRTLSAAFFDHLMPFAVVWLLAWLLAQHRSLQDRLNLQNQQLQRHQLQLEEQVRLRTAELEASERRYRLLAENAADIIWTVDMDGSFTYVSPSSQRVRGVTGEEEQASSWFDRMPPATAAAAAAKIEADLAALRASLPIDQTPHPAPAYRKDGTLMWSETIMIPLYDDGGQPLGLCGTTRDITARHAAEEALAASERKYRDLYDNSPDMYFVGHLWDDTILDCNRTLLHTFGGTGEELIGRPSAILFEPGSYAAALATRSQLLAAGKSENIEARLYCKDGTVLDVLMSATVESEPGSDPPLARITLRNVTERKRLEEALRDSEERFRLIVQNSPDVLALYDDQGCLSYLSPAVASTHGVTVEHALAIDPLFVAALRTPPGSGPQPAELDRIRSLPSFADRRRIDETVTYCLEHPGEQRRLEVTNVLSSGEVKYFDIAYRGHWRTGGTRQVVSITRDNTARKHLEQQLQAFNDNLEHRIAARTADLEAALAELQRANRLKDDFMAMISHELRTPLTGVLTLSEMLVDEIVGPLNTRQSAYVHGITESGERLLAVINGILSYTHLLSGKFRLAVEHCELSYLLNICAAQQHKAAARQQAIALTVTPPNLAILVDPTALAEVLKRLLDNAAKFTPEGGRIGLEAHPGTAPGTVDLVVWDTGIGIAPDQLDHVFHAFTQADGCLSRSHEGIGLGLAYVDQMVRIMGGTIAVASSPGAGSRFTITLPAERRLSVRPR